MTSTNTKLCTTPIPQAAVPAASPVLDDQPNRGFAADTERPKVDTTRKVSQVLDTPSDVPVAVRSASLDVHPRLGTLTLNWVNDLDPSGDGQLVQARAQWAELSTEAKTILRKEIYRLTGQLHSL